MVLSIEKCFDFWSRDPWCTLPIQHGKDHGGREATNRVEEILGNNKRRLFQEGWKGALILHPGVSTSRTSAGLSQHAESSSDFGTQIVSEPHVHIA